VHYYLIWYCMYIVYSYMHRVIHVQSYFNVFIANESAEQRCEADEAAAIWC